MKHVLFAVLVLFIASPIRAQERGPQFSFSVFSYQLPSGGWHHAHSWLCANSGTDAACLSWGPVGPVRLGRVEVGRNQTHAETLAFAKSVGAVVRQFGPYPCSPELFARIKAQEKRLGSGEVLYKPVVTCLGCGRVNCKKAVAECGYGLFVEGLDYGHAASRRLAWYLLRKDR